MFTLGPIPATRRRRAAPESSLVIPARQDRSRRAERRLIDALVALLATRPYERITVPDIAARAGLAVGSVYRRFPGKERLLLHAAEDLARRVLMPGLARAARRERWDDLPAGAAIARYLTFVARTFRRHRPLLRAVAIVSRLNLEPDLTRVVLQSNRVAHERLRGILLARRAELQHPRPTLAIDLGILWASAALREIVLFEQPVSALARRTSLTVVVAELAKALCDYVRIPARSGGAS